MKALVCTENGPIAGLKIQDIPTPDLRPGCVRLRITVASVNPPDILMAEGRYQVKPLLPFVLGIEGAGVVLEAASDIDRFKPGDRVMTYAGRGCFAEEAVVDARQVFHIPPEMNDDTAAGFVLAYGTVYHALIDCGAIGRGQTIAVLGAAGGLGSAAIQLAKAVGARVIAVASTVEKRATCMENGADEVLASDPETLRDAIRTLTDGRGADVVLDTVGGDLTDPALRAIAPYGRFVIAGYASGRIPDIKANLILLKQATVVGASYRQLAQNRPDAAAANIRVLTDMWIHKRLRPQVSSRYPFAQVTDALALVADRRVVGKAAVVI